MSNNNTKENFKEFYDNIKPLIGGGGTSVIANKFDKANLYSTDEQIVGRWIDGKPLYQKVVSGLNLVISYNSFTNSGIDASDVDQCISCKGFDENGSSLGEILCSTYGTGQRYTTWSLQTVRNGAGIAVSTLTLQYTKTTDEAIEIGSDTDYSTTEKIIGTWIDGKPIYEKVSLTPIIIGDDNKITGTSFASSEYSSGNRNYVFDNDTTSNWAPARTSNPSYIGYKNTEEFIFYYATATIKDAGNDTEDWYIEGSNDGTTWTRISEIVNHTSNTPSGTTYTFNSINTTNTYTNIRLYTTSGLLPSDSNGAYTTIGTLRFYKKLFNDDYDTIIKNDKIHDNSYYILQYTKTTD